MTFLKQVMAGGACAVIFLSIFGLAHRVSAAAPLTCRFNATPSVVHGIDDVVTLSWQAPADAQVRIEPGFGSRAATGTMEVKGFRETTTYTMIARRGSEAVQCRSTVVYRPTEPTNMGTLPCRIAAIPGALPGGGSVLLQWSAPEAQEAELVGIGMVPKVGSRVIEGVSAPQTFRLQVKNGTQSGSCSVTVQADPAVTQAPSCSLTVMGERLLEPGEATSLVWHSSNAVYAAITHLGQVPASGELRIAPSQTTHFVMVVRDVAGRESFCEATVEVRPSGGLIAQAGTRTPAVVPSGMLPLQYLPYTGVDAAKALWLFSLLALFSWVSLPFVFRLLRR